MDHDDFEHFKHLIDPKTNDDFEKNLLIQGNREKDVHIKENLFNKMLNESFKR